MLIINQLWLAVHQKLNFISIIMFLSQKFEVEFSNICKQLTDNTNFIKQTKWWLTVIINLGPLSRVAYYFVNCYVVENVTSWRQHRKKSKMSSCLADNKAHIEKMVVGNKSAKCRLIYNNVCSDILHDKILFLSIKLTLWWSNYWLYLADNSTK